MSAQVYPVDDRIAESRLVGRLMAMWREGVEYRQEWSGSWQDAWDYFMGNHWKGSSASVKPKRNYIASKTQSVKAMLTDNRIRIQALPRRDDFKEYADALDRLIDYQWGRQDMDYKLDQGILLSLLYSKGIYYSFFCHDSRDIRTEIVEPQCFAVNRGATCIDDARWAAHKTKMSRSAILHQWPDAAGKLRPGAEPSQDEGNQNLEGQVESIAVGTKLDSSGASLGGADLYYKVEDGTQKPDDMIPVYQFWIRDEETVQEEYRLPNGEIVRYTNGEPVLIERYRYHGGRHVVIANNRVIHDGCNPFEHQRFPYVEHDCYKVPGHFWGMSFVHNLIDLQKEINKTLQQIIESKNLTANPMFKYRRGRIKSEALVARPGLKIPVDQMDDIDIIVPPPLPNYVVQFLTDMEMAMDRVSGVPDVMEGRKPTGIQSGVAIEGLVEMANTKIRDLARATERAMSNLGSLWIGLARQYYTEAREIRLVDPQTGGYTFVRVTPEMIRGEWDVFAVPGSSLPKSRDARFRQALEAMQAGLFDQEGALEWFDHPASERMLARKRELERMQMEAAAEANAPLEEGM